MKRVKLIIIHFHANSDNKIMVSFVHKENYQNLQKISIPNCVEIYSISCLYLLKPTFFHKLCNVM